MGRLPLGKNQDEIISYVHIYTICLMSLKSINSKGGDALTSYVDRQTDKKTDRVFAGVQKLSVNVAKQRYKARK